MCWFFIVTVLVDDTVGEKGRHRRGFGFVTLHQARDQKTDGRELLQRSALLKDLDEDETSISEAFEPMWSSFELSSSDWLYK